MDYLRQIFNTPFNLWTVGQATVFTLMFLGALAVIFMVVGVIYWLIQKIKSHKDRKTQEKQQGGNIDQLK